MLVHARGQQNVANNGIVSVKKLLLRTIIRMGGCASNSGTRCRCPEKQVGGDVQCDAQQRVQPGTASIGVHVRRGQVVYSIKKELDSWLCALEMHAASSYEHMLKTRKNGAHPEQCAYKMVR
jgi:hypothetical protein